MDWKPLQDFWDLDHAYSCQKSARRPIFSPPESSDLSTLEFFDWGFIISVVYKQKIEILDVLKQRIIQVIRLITSDTLRKRFAQNWFTFRTGLDVCYALKGTNIEIY